MATSPREGDSWVVKSEEIQAVRTAARRGLGDLVAAVAQPIARVIDAAAGTKLAECGGCKQRRAALNRIHL